MLRLWIFRMLVPLGGYREFLCSYGFGDDSLAQYIGLTVQDSKYDTPFLLGTLRQLHQQREAERGPRGLPALLSCNLDRVSQLLGLDDAARCILGFAVLLHSEPWLQRAARQLGRVNASRLIEVLTEVLDLNGASVRQALSPEGALNATGMLRIGARSVDDLLDHLTLLSDTMEDRM